LSWLEFAYSRQRAAQHTLIWSYSSDASVTRKQTDRFTPTLTLGPLQCWSHFVKDAGFKNLMAFLGLVPSERSTGDDVRRAGLTLAGNRRARRALVEGAWTYRYPARVRTTLQKRLAGIPKPVRDIAWKAQVRLCGRFRRLAAIGKKRPVIVAASAREMAAFLRAIGQPIAPAS
jgi:hypothetical protein